MSEYYAEHESIEEVSARLKEDSSQMETSATELDASRRKIEQSDSLTAYGYASLVDQTRRSVYRLSRRENRIANVLDTVSALYADYEGRVIAALNDSTSAGNNYSNESRYEVRDVNDGVIRIKITPIPMTPGFNPNYGGNTDPNTGGNQGTNTPLNPPTSGTIPSNNEITDYINPTPEQKRRYTLEWLEKTHPELLEQIYDRLHGGAAGTVASGAFTAGMGGAMYWGASRQNPSMGGLGGSQGGTGTGSYGSGSGQSQPVAGTGTSAGGTGSGAGSGLAGDASGMAGDAGAAGGYDSGGIGAGDAGGAGAGGAGVGGMGEDSDWVADMLNDAVDSDAAQAAQSAIGGAASTTNPEATASGAAAMTDSASAGFATDEQSGFARMMSDLGAGLLGAVRKYGLNAGILAGGAGAAYASSGVAIEAVAHCAEFVATKCMPGVRGFMDQVSAAAQVTRVSIRMTLGNIVQGVSNLAG